MSPRPPRGRAAKHTGAANAGQQKTERRCREGGQAQPWGTRKRNAEGSVEEETAKFARTFDRPAKRVVCLNIDASGAGSGRVGTSWFGARQLTAPGHGEKSNTRLVGESGNTRQQWVLRSETDLCETQNGTPGATPQKAALYLCSIAASCRIRSVNRRTSPGARRKAPDVDDREEDRRRKSAPAGGRTKGGPANAFHWGRRLRREHKIVGAPRASAKTCLRSNRCRARTFAANSMAQWILEEATTNGGARNGAAAPATTQTKLVLVSRRVPPRNATRAAGRNSSMAKFEFLLGEA